MPDQNAEPPLANTPEFSLSRDRQNGDPPGTNWGNIVRKNADRQAAEQKTAADEQAVIDSQRMKDRAKANERENEIRELRAQQRMLEKQNEGLSRKNPEFVVGGSEAIQRATDERADLIREKQRQIDAIQNRR